MLTQFNFSAYLLAPRSVLSIAVLRITFGIFVMWQSFNKGVSTFTGTAADGFEFKYPFFTWVHGSPEYASYLSMAWFASGALVCFGLFYRVSAPICLLISTYSYLIAADRYLNHEYMELIFLFLLSLSPAHYRLSVDSYFWKLPRLAPAYFLLALKIQTEIVLIYAGLVKINYDWLHLQPLSNWLAQRSDLIFFGEIWLQTWSVALGAYGIIFLHVFGAPLMFWKRTRLLVFILYTCFHTINSQIFPIDIFPWMTIACSTLFFEADWPAQIFHRFKRFVGWRSRTSSSKPEQRAHKHDYQAKIFGSLDDKIFISVFGVWLLAQALIPIRSALYKGEVDWTGEGHRFSWRMMLEQRNCPVLNFVLIDPKSKKVIFADLRAMVNSQKKMNFVCKEPDHILQTASILKNIYMAKLNLSEETAVHAYMMRSLNFRKPTLYVDPKRDLSRESIYSFGYTWINRDAELEALPAPGTSEIKEFAKPKPRDVGLAVGVDIDRDYVCGYGPTPQSNGGTDIICNAKN